MKEPQFFGVIYSPWTERARWALDHHAIAYRYREHIPFLGERLLRFRARNTGQSIASVPLLLHGDRAYGDSLDIIAWADENGSSPQLIRDREATIRWRDRIQIGLDAARARATGRILRDKAALTESVMGVSPAFLAPLFRPLAVQGAQYLAHKYGADVRSDVDHETPMAELLEDIRAARTDRDYILDDGFSAVDILATTFLQAVKPVGAPHIPLRPAVSRAWGCEQLASDYADLVAWRDALYQRHRLH